MSRPLKYGEPTVDIHIRVPKSRKEEIREVVRNVLNGNDGWISVQTPPITYCNYIVCTGNWIGELTYHELYGWCWFKDDDSVSEFNTSVEHYMPLPNPPKGK